LLGAALGQEAAERVVEPPGRRRGVQALLSRHRSRRQPPITAHHPEHHRRAQVAGRPGVGLGRCLAESRTGAAGPEQRADHEADRTADRDVLDPDQADLPPRGAMML
jgi:hypothetical protein